MNQPVPTISSLQVLPVVAAFDALGLDTARVLARAGLSRTSLVALARLPAEAEIRMWEAAVLSSGDGALGLRVAEQLKPGAMGSFEYLLRNSETLEQMLSRAQRYGRVVDDLSQVSLRRADGMVDIQVGRVGNYPVPPGGIECLFSVAIAIARNAWPNLRRLGVRFAHAAMADAALYRAHFGCSVRFDAPANEISCDEAVLREPSLHVDANLGNVLEEHTRHLLAQLPRADDFADHARQHLRGMLGRSALQPEALARALHVSERTMRRRLATQGTSYQQLLDEIRHELALTRVAHEDTSFEHLAEALGFADTSTFYRTFKRWTGTTPAKYRARK